MRHLTMSGTAAAAICAAAFFSVAEAAIEQVVVTGAESTEDTTLYQNAADENAGGWQAVASGSTLAGFPRRTLIRFDLDVVPSGSTVSSAQLDLRLAIAAAAGSEETTLTLHRVTSDWAEGTGLAGLAPMGGGGQGGDVLQGTACWSAGFLGTSAWTTPGGDFVETPSAATLVTLGVGEDFAWTGENLVADVQAMIDGTAPNYGWILVEEPDSAGSGRAFLSSEAPANLGPAPRLTIGFEPTPVPTESYWILN